MTTRFMMLGLGAAATACALSPAAAQDAAPRQADTSTPQGAGQGIPVPRKVEEVRRISLDLSAFATYDTNVTRSSAQRAAANGLQREDFFIAPTAAVDVSLPFGRSVAYLKGTIAYSIYSRSKRLNGERIVLDGGLSTKFGRCSLAADGSYGRIRSDPGDFAVAGTDPLRDRNFETTQSIGVTGDCGGIVGIQPFGSFQYTRGVNSSILRRGSNYETLTYGGGIRYVQPSIGEIGLIGSIQNTSYTQRDGSLGTLLSGLRSFPTRSIGVYYTRNVTRFFFARVRLDYTDVATGQATRFAGLTGEASVRITPSERIQFDAGINRSSVPTLAYNIDYYVETAANVGVTVRPAKRVTLDATYTYRYRRYFATNPSLLFPLNSDNSNLIAANASYRLNAKLAFITGVAYEERRADNAFYDFDSFRLVVGVRGTF